MNESGKTVFLQSLQKSRDVLGIAKFDPIDDYPGKDLPNYLKQHPKKPSIVTTLIYQLTKEELEEVNELFPLKLNRHYRE